jgi:hypothetical protein
MKPPLGILRPAILLALGLPLLAGCVNRRILVTSEPPGATVWVNDTQAGRTPTEVGFKYFGVYDVRLRLDGYEPLTTKAEAKAPLYEYPPFDAVAEALPGTRETVVKWHFVMQPALELQGDPKEQEKALIQRAKELATTIEQPAAPAPAPAAAAPEPATTPAPASDANPK